MGLQPGERQAQRTKKALIDAFAQLMHERNYQAITIADIVERANTGRSTFYRHFQSKADVLLEIHADTFDRWNLGSSLAEGWVADEPSAQLVLLLERFQKPQNLPVFFSNDLGNDTDYIVRKMDALLSRQIEKELHQAFSEEAGSIPFSVLAQSIAGIYSWLYQSWRSEHQAFSPVQMAGYIHRLTRSAIREAFA